MNKLKSVLVLLVALAMVINIAAIVGCGKKEDNSVKVGNYKSNNITEIYVGTAVVVFSYDGDKSDKKENDSKSVKAGENGENTEIDITDVKTNTVEEKYKLPKFETENSAVNYFSPIFIEGDVKSIEIASVTAKAAEEAKENEATTDTAKFGDETIAQDIMSAETAEESARETKLEDLIVTSGKTTLTSDNYIFWTVGEYAVEVNVKDFKGEAETLEYTIEVKEGSLLDELANGEGAVSNMMFNKNSASLTAMKVEIETELPLAIEDYMINVPDDYLNSFVKDNESILKQLNVINSVKGEKALTVEEIFVKYGTEEAIAAAKVSADGTEKSYDGNGLVRTTHTVSTDDIENTINSYTRIDSGISGYFLLNNLRERCGLTTFLEPDSNMENLAYQRAMELVNDFSHHSVGGYNKGYAENIAMGYLPDAASVLVGWYNSPGHRANMLGNYQFVGMAHFNENGTDYWVQLFDTSLGQEEKNKNPEDYAGTYDNPLVTQVSDENGLTTYKRYTYVDSRGDEHYMETSFTKTRPDGDEVCLWTVLENSSKQKGAPDRSDYIEYYDYEHNIYGHSKESLLREGGVEQPDGTIIREINRHDLNPNGLTTCVFTPYEKYITYEHHVTATTPVGGATFTNTFNGYKTYECDPYGNITGVCSSSPRDFLFEKDSWNVGDTFYSTIC